MRMLIVTFIFVLLCSAAHGHLWMDKENITLSQNGLGAFQQGCMECICYVEGCQKNIGKCKMDMGSPSCGPFQIKEKYWIDCGKPGADWQSCTKQMACSVMCIEAYMTHYGRFCTHGREPTCRDYARMQNGGPTSCRPQTGKKEKRLVKYWSLVAACCQHIKIPC